MRTKHNFRKKNFLALCLSVLMLGSTAIGLAACTTDETNPSTENEVTESTKKTVGLVDNANFETASFNDTTPIITSPSGWTKTLGSDASGSVRYSSEAASGIIDTSKEAWENLTKGKVENAATLSDADAESKWEEMSVWDKLAFYKDWDKREENDDKKLSSLSFYQSFNIDFDDIPATEVNPLTHDYDKVNNKEADDTKVLMIHNEYSTSESSTPHYKKQGLAQKYTSSSTVTVSAGTNATFSVWVKTADLSTAWTDGSSQDAEYRGAYISVTHTVGGKSLDPLVVKNINTEKINPDGNDNGWVKYEFLLKGAAYADSTFTIVLGLGMGGQTDKLEYVNGYAFFDDITCEKLTDSDYATKKAETTAAIEINDTENPILANERTNERKFALETLAMDDSKINDITYTVNGKSTTEKSGTKTWTAASNPVGVPAGVTAETYTGLGFNTTNDKYAFFDNATLVNMANDQHADYDSNVAKVYNNYLASESAFFNLIKTKPMLLFLSTEGAAYTAKADTNYTVSSESYMAISFFVKTSDFNGVTGAGVKVQDANNKNTTVSLSNLDTTNITKVDINDTTKDIYDGWQQCFLFIGNETETAQQFELTFSFGSTTVIGTTKANYESGFAALANFQVYTLDKEEFERATAGTYTQILQLTGEEKEETGDEGFDSAVSVPFDSLEKGYTNLKNYKGVASDSAYLGNGSITDVNTNATAGLLSKKNLQLEDKTANTNYTDILTTLGATATTNEDKWTEVFGDATQPLVIYNGDTEATAYGFIGASQTVATDGYATVSLRVKVGKGATAFVYLIDTNSESFSTLSMDRKLTYWYDADGNLCDKDPTAADFNKKTNVAFKRNAANGLYRANSSWTNYNQLSDADKSAYFANLSAYTETDGRGNLLVAENGVSYDYNDNWQHEGNNGIAFYKGENGYYADKACTVLVKDFASITKADENDTTKPLTARYQAKVATENEQFSFKIDGPTETGVLATEWITVTFYLHAGNEAKNYRLEVWSGARDGSVKSDAASFVAFDANKPDDITAENFTTLLDEVKEGLSEDKYFESAFAFYDAASFLRYTADLDEKNVGDSYEDYDPTIHTSGVAFLRSETDTAYTIFADYSLSEVSVAADVEEEDTETDEEEDTESETNVWLLISSISIAGVLVLAVISLIVRKAVSKSRRNHRKAAATTTAKKAKKAKKN